jgi:hypothetical protein
MAKTPKKKKKKKKKKKPCMWFSGLDNNIFLLARLRHSNSPAHERRLQPIAAGCFPVASLEGL